MSYTNRSPGHALCLMCIAIIAQTSAAAGQQAASPAGQDNGNMPSSSQQASNEVAFGELQEIVVTARRRAETLEQVPISITAVSQAQLENQQVVNATDLQRLAPSLVAQGGMNRNLETFSIRGIGQSSNGSGAGVVSYFADVPITAITSTGSIGVNGVYFDLQDVQILRGPQGTLFGRNTTGGAVLFQPNRPSNKLEGDLEVGLGDYNMNSLKAMINLPIVDELSVRIAANVFRRDGFTTDVGPYFPGRVYDNKDQVSFRVGVLFTPTEFLENYLLFSYADSKTNGTGFELAALDPAGVTAAVYGSQGTNALATQQSLGPRRTSLDLAEVEKNRNTGVINTTKISLGSDLQLKNIASYQVFEYLSRVDWDGSNLQITERTDPQRWSESLSQVTEELQLQGLSFGKTLDWTIGAYYDDSRPTELFNQLPISFGGTPFAVGRENFVGTWDRSIAGYAQATYDLAALVPGLKVTGGYRYTHESLESKDNAYLLDGSCPFKAGFTFPNCETINGLSDSAGIYNVDVDYEFAPKTHGYVAVRTGFKTGGFSPNAPVPYESFGPEHVTAFEGGIKSNFTIGDIKGAVRADIYQSNYKDIQVPDSLFTGGTVVAITDNHGRARIKGVEFEGSLYPTTSVELSASYGYTDAYYLVPPSDAPPGFTTLPNAPKNTFSVAGRYHLPIPEAVGELSVGTTYSYQSADYRGFATSYTLYSGYGLLNANLDWKEFLGKPMDLAIFVTNATNKTYEEGGINFYGPLGFNAVYFGPPRMFGATVRYHF
jgi:iron complex outermembrane receptor protein